jgi:hypothetical protein
MRPSTLQPARSRRAGTERPWALPWGGSPIWGPIRSRVWRQGRPPGAWTGSPRTCWLSGDESRPGGYWPSSQHPGVAGAGQLGGGLGQRVLLGEGERERLLHIHQAAKLLQAGDLAAVDVVVDRIAVLGEEAQDGQQVLGDVGHQDDSRDPGTFTHQVLWPSRYGAPSGQVQPPLGEPAVPQRRTPAADHDGWRSGRTGRGSRG